MPALFGLAMIGIFCLIGMAFRRYVPLFRNNMVPAFVIGGFLGAIAMNVGLSGVLDGVDSDLFAMLTAQLFIISFISIGLTPPPPQIEGKQNKARKVLLRGAWAMGITWVIVFAVQALLGVGLVAASTGSSGMDPIYGFMIPFAFAQGPGQAVTFAGIFEDQGWTDAINVGLAFSAVGFAAAFLVGVPLAKWGMNKGLANHAMEITESVEKGYFEEHEDTEPMGTETTFAGNIDTMSFHFAMVGVAYLLAHGMSWVLAFIPGFVGETISGMLFMLGLFAAYFLRFLLDRMNKHHLLDRELQAKVTGFSTDFLVVASFMAVQASVVLAWIVPILVTALVVVVVTVVLVTVIGQRYGTDHDFERTMGMYGTLTGTTPTGLALVRILDPRMRTQTMAEMGLMNLPELLYLPAMLTISAAFAASTTLPVALAIIGGLLVGYVALLLVTRSVGKRTWGFAGPTEHAPADESGPVMPASTTRTLPGSETDA